MGRIARRVAVKLLPMTDTTIAAPPVERRQLRARLLAKREVAPRHFLFAIECPHVARGARPGQFVHILPAAQADESEGGWSFDPFLRRAFSVMDVRGDEFNILFRVEGRGTQTLARANEGDGLDLIGPLGNGFSLARAERSAILVGGGVGVPPMVFTYRALQERGVGVQMLLGARSAKDVLCEGRFPNLAIATDDGSRGYAGRVGDLLNRALQNEPPDIVFACGPYPMLRAVAGLCAARGVECEVSLEENMPCGIGVCNGCIVPMRDANGGDYGRFRRICVQGPACDAREIDWT